MDKKKTEQALVRAAPVQELTQHLACPEALHLACDPHGDTKGPAGLTRSSPRPRALNATQRCPTDDAKGMGWAAVGQAGQKGRQGRGRRGQRPGSRAVTRVELAAKGGIYGPQRERRARAGPALHRPPLITFSGPLPAGTDNAGGAFEVPKGCRGGSRESSPFPPSSRGRGPAGQNPEPVTARPEPRETKGKQTGLESGARCRVCPPPCRAGMMDGFSQPARPPGRSCYLHNTGVPPVTSDTALPGA